MVFITLPFHFKRKDEGVFSLAGIYSVLRGGLCTFTIFTKKATPLFGEIHNSKKRQPLMLNHAETSLWLDRNTAREDIERLLVYNFDNTKLDAYPISRDFNKTSVDTNIETITRKVDYFQSPDSIKGFNLRSYKFKHIF